MQNVRPSLPDDRGASMVEYGLIVALVAVMALTALTLLGRRTESTFTTVAVAMDSSTTPGGSSQGPGGSDVDSGSGGNTNSGSDDEEAGQDDQSQGGSQDDQSQGGSQEDQSQGGDQGEDLDQSGDSNDPASGDDQSDGSDQNDQSGGSGPGAGGDTSQPEEPKEEEMPEETPSLGSGGSSELYWWDTQSTKGQWKASVSYQNTTNRHQYLTLEVTQIDDKGKKTTTTVKNFYVGAGSSSTYTHWSNDINQHQKKVSGVLEVQVEVVSITTSDQNWKSYSYDVSDKAASVAAPKLP